MFMTSADSSMETKARCSSLVWFGRAVAGRPLVSLTTRSVAGPKRSSTTLFKKNGSVTTMLSTRQKERNAVSELRGLAGLPGGAARPALIGRLQTLEQPIGGAAD